MQATAKLSNIKISPKKAVLVVDAIRGLTVVEAEKLLRTTPKKAAHFLLKVLLSAAANARQLSGKTKEELKITEIKVDGGPMLKRGQPVSRGMWHPILKRTSHISVSLGEVNKK